MRDRRKAPWGPVTTVAALCGAQVLTMLGTFAFPALLPRFVASWGLSHTEAGWVSGAYFAGYTLAVPVLASLTDRLDGRRVYLGGAAVAAGAAAGFALLAQGFWTALGLRALAGVGLAGTFIPGLKALVDRLPPQAQPRAVSWYTAAFGLGTSASFWAAGAVAEAWGWRWVFGVGAGGAALGLVLAARALPPRPIAPSGAPALRLLNFRPVFANREAMGYILAYAAHTWELFAFRSWVVAFLVASQTLGPPPGGGAWAPTTVAAVTGLAALWASVGGGEAAQRLGRRRVLTAIMGASAVAACGLGAAASLSYPVVAALCVGYALLVQGDSAALHMGTVAAADPARRGLTLALQSLLGFGAASVGPLAVGAVLDATGGGETVASWTWGFATMGAGVALGPLFLWWTRPLGGRVFKTTRNR